MVGRVEVSDKYLDQICFHFEQPHVSDGWIIKLDEGEKQQEWDMSSFKPVLPYFKVSLNTEAKLLRSLMKLLWVDLKCLGLEENPDYTTWNDAPSLDLKVELLRERASASAWIISEDGCILPTFSKAGRSTAFCCTVKCPLLWGHCKPISDLKRTDNMKYSPW